MLDRKAHRRTVVRAVEQEFLQQRRIAGSKAGDRRE